MARNNLPPGNGMPRRHFLHSSSLAAATLCGLPATRLIASASDEPASAAPAEKLCLWYDRPAKTWMTEALPIGNGPMGAMLFGGTEIERIQFNEISLWTGDRMAGGKLLVDAPEEEAENLGAHQAFGDIFIHLGHDFSKVTGYRQEFPPGPHQGMAGGASA